MSSYAERVSRNIGVLSLEEQQKLCRSRVGIAGLGGVGGTHALLLARMGVGNFAIADFDVFEAANLNRQAGAFHSTFGQTKVSVIKRQILDINPEAIVEEFPEGLNPSNIDAFLKGTDLVMDGVDFFALEARRMVFTAAEKKGIYIVTSGPLGQTCTLHVFGPGAMPSEKYFDYASCRDRIDELIAFLVGVGPAMIHVGQVDKSSFSFRRKKAASIGSAIYLCAGLACSEACKILTGRGNYFLAPRYLQFDPAKYRLRTGHLWFGNRGPLQKIRRMIVRKMIGNS